MGTERTVVETAGREIEGTKARRRLAVVVAGVLAISLTVPATAQKSVLVDASKGGGVWWFPQAPPDFDPDLPHQGKALADHLRSQGLVVTELPRLATITCEELSRHHLVMVTGACNTYSAAEIGAYAGFLSRGGRLILLGENTCDFDNLPQALGLDFTGSLAGTITDLEPHPITQGVTAIPFLVGGAIASEPPSALVLGTLSGSPVMGMLHVGGGKVFFLGDVNGLQTVPRPFVDNLFGFMLAGAQTVDACH